MRLQDWLFFVLSPHEYRETPFTLNMLQAGNIEGLGRYATIAGSLPRPRWPPFRHLCVMMQYYIVSRSGLNVAPCNLPVNEAPDWPTLYHAANA